MNPRAMKIHFTGATVLLTSLALSACGGGSGSSLQQASQSLPEAPELSLDYSPVKTFRFTWSDVAGETEYRLLEDPDGISGYTVVASLAADSTGYDLEVFLPGRINARYLLQACNDAGCSDSDEVMVDVPAMTAAIGYVKASNPDSNDFFGVAMALSADGRTLAVGATGEDSDGSTEADNSLSRAGAVYVYVLDGDTWTQQAYLKASNADGFDWFGSAVALSASGDTLAVGAYSEDGNGSDAGAVYVFNRNGGVWIQKAYVKASNTGQHDMFGDAIALSADGRTLAVGAPREDSDGSSEADNSALDAGAVYVYVLDGDTWTQQAYLKASNADGFDWFGSAVALSASGDTLAVGAYSEDGNGSDAGDNSLPDAGAVYVFDRDGNAWSQQAYVKASNAGEDDQFGRAVALSADGRTLAVGAPWEGSDGSSEADNSLPGAGAVYLYRFDGQSWSQEAYLKASNPKEFDVFGSTVALSADGDILVVGAFGEGSTATGLGGDALDDNADEAGAVYLYRYDGGTWGQRAYVKASNTDAGDVFGRLALSADGHTLAVGAPWEDSDGSSEADNSVLDAGAVYLY